MKIVVAGTRGIPEIPGGVERHCEELYPRLAAMGHEVVVCTRSVYVTSTEKRWRGVRLVRLFAPRSKTLEAIVHTTLAVLYAWTQSPDVLHVHAVGPSLVVPLAKLLGLRVVFTNHGPDYERAKWGRVGRTTLRLGEWLGGRFADEVIVISPLIGSTVKRRCGREGRLILNGVPPARRVIEYGFLREIGVVPGNYVLAVARLVPEKGLHDLIEAFAGMRRGLQLVIAGGADHETAYSRELRHRAAEIDSVVLTGYIAGSLLDQVYSHARAFCLPSSHEGLPIALLEALSYGLPALASDIPANREIAMPSEWYFRCGDAADLRARLESMLASERTMARCEEMTERVRSVYDWNSIAGQVARVYDLAVDNAHGGGTSVGF